MSLSLATWWIGYTGVEYVSTRSVTTPLRERTYRRSLSLATQWFRSTGVEDTNTRKPALPLRESAHRQVSHWQHSRFQWVVWSVLAQRKWQGHRERTLIREVSHRSYSELDVLMLRVLPYRESSRNQEIVLLAKHLSGSVADQIRGCLWYQHTAHDLATGRTHRANRCSSGNTPCSTDGYRQCCGCTNLTAERGLPNAEDFSAATWQVWREGRMSRIAARSPKDRF